MMITISEAPLHNEVINTKITNFTKELHSLIYANLREEFSHQKKQQISSMLVGHTFGMLSLMRCQNVDEIVEQQILGVLSVLENFEENGSATI